MQIQLQMMEHLKWKDEMINWAKLILLKSECWQLYVGDNVRRSIPDDYLKKEASEVRDKNVRDQGKFGTKYQSPKLRKTIS